MPGTDGLSQKRASRQRKTGDPTPLQLSEALDGEPRATEDDFMLDDDGTTSPNRSHSTTIRRANLVSPPRTGPSQISPIPQRRTGGQGPRPEQPTASLPTSLQNKPYPRGNIRRQQALPPNIFKGKVHWLLPLGIGMIAMLVLWELGSFTLAWGLARYDDIRYGNPRTYQTFRDVTGDSKPDMIIHIHLQTQDQTFVFVNDGNKFRPPTSKDNIHL